MNGKALDNMLQKSGQTLLYLGVLCLYGCTSSFDARRVGSDGKLAGTDGIPYTMNKPEFRLTRTVASGKPSYALSVAYVPDPDQKFTIRASPSLWADTDFTVNIGETGGLGDVGLTTTDRIAPTLTALATLLPAVLALGILDDADLAGELLKVIDSAGFRCPNDPSGKALNSLKNYVNSLDVMSKKEAEELKTVTANSIFTSKFHARNIDDRDCLASITNPAELSEALAVVLGLPPKDWRARHIEYLNAKIAAESFNIVLAGRNPSTDQSIIGDQNELARTVGKEAAQRRLRQLDARLDKVPGSPVGRSSAFAEYALIRNEASQIQAQIDTAIGDALAAVAPKYEPFDGKVIPVTSVDCIGALASKDCPANDFVAVLERVK